MPTPAQTREQRLTELFEIFKGQNTSTVDPIINKALELYPNITEERARNYARAVLRMLKAKKKGVN